MVFGSSNSNGMNGILGASSYPAISSGVLSPGLQSSTDISDALKELSKKARRGENPDIGPLLALAASDPAAAKRLSRTLQGLFKRQADAHLKNALSQLHADSGKRHKEWLEKQKHLLDGEDDGSSTNFLA